MSTKNRLPKMYADTPAPPTPKADYNASLATLREVAGCDRELSFPCTIEDATEWLRDCGYIVPHNAVENALGELPVAVDADDFRRLHLYLERGRFWQPFPCKPHDAKKSASQLSHEIATWYERVSRADRDQWLQLVAPEYVCLLAAASSEPHAQQLWCEIALRKFGLAREIDPSQLKEIPRG